jgi:hypothetical protein
MSLSSVQQSEKEVTTVTGGVQNATRNSIGQKVTEILMPQDTKHLFTVVLSDVFIEFSVLFVLVVFCDL